MSTYGAPQGRPRFGLSLGRIVIALIIAAVGVITYLSQTETNPVTGEKQHVALNVDQEMALGLESVPRMAAEMGGVLDPAQSPEARLVQEVGQRIVARSNAAQSPYAGNFHFLLAADPDTINAFSLPGGQIFMTRALLMRLTDEAQVAAVLGHEVGHVINRHVAEQMAKGQLGQTLTMATAVGASDSEGRGMRAQMVAAMVNQMLQLKFGRKDETESDHYGLAAMAAAGYDPSAMLDVMRILKEASGGARQPEILATHPLPDTRIDDIQQYLQREYPQGIPRELSRGRAFQQ